MTALESDKPARALPDYVFTHERVYPGNREDLVALLPHGLGRVLDVGCGPGGFGEALVAAGKADSVIGIDLSTEAVREAAGRLEAAHRVDLDADPAPFPEASFDSIIYADVLEHLKYPWEVVRAQRPLLRPGGRAFCSIPNVAHVRVVTHLLRQRWEYQSEGIFDYTHLRFFARGSLDAMFRSAGYTHVVVAPLQRASTRVRLFNLLTLGSLRGLTVRSWWLTASG
ncbi:MAG: class I SAM-dependent methyltransferase [Candidatus Dormibacteria bacterium]